MELNSLNFVAFLAVVFILYYSFQKWGKIQNVILLIASYSFYALASWKIVPILLLMTLFFFGMGIWVEKKCDNDDEKGASIITICTIVIGLLPLIYFKYFGFFVEQFQILLSLLGFQKHDLLLNILLPLGLSFYTFRLLCYIIDIEQYTIRAEHNLLDFALYVAYFPSLVAGPIDKPNTFIPQLKISRKANYDYMVIGLRRFVWGWFMKVCVADRIASYTTYILDNYSSQNGTTLLIAFFLLPMQSYADFAGYSHMAIGASKMFGITSTENFNRPFFAQNISEFWQRWHMSLTKWLNDYVYTPLNFALRKYGRWGIMFATILNLIIVGVWHQAGWNYMLFGLYHALLFIPIIFWGFGKQTGLDSNGTSAIIKILKSSFLYLFISIGSLLVCVKNIDDVCDYYIRMFSGFGFPTIHGKINFAIFLVGIVVIMIKDYRDEIESPKNILKSSNIMVIVLELSLLTLSIFLLGSTTNLDFVYKQF